MKKIVILIPIFNDWKSVFKLLENINSEVSSLEGEFSIIIVNDASLEARPEISVNLENAVKEIFSELKNNKFKSTILLSPGCSSFDQFIDFEDRGNQFKKIIMNEMIKFK